LAVICGGGRGSQEREGNRFGLRQKGEVKDFTGEVRRGMGAIKDTAARS